MKSSTSRPPTASALARTPKSRSRSTTRSGAAGREDRHELGIGLAEHERAPGLHDPGLLLGDAGPGRAEVLDVVELTLVTTATCAVDHVGRVPAPAQADLDHRDVDRDVGEPLAARRR